MVIKKLNKDELLDIIAKTGFDYDLLIKDYYITALLFLMKDIKGIYFKGGTALAKTILKHSRLSEDIDFTVKRPVSEVKDELIKLIEHSKLFDYITQDKNVDKFLRLVVHYNSELGSDKIFVDLNKRSNLFLEFEFLEIEHFYQNIPKFHFPCLNKVEMIAEKMAATIHRNKPRDNYDLYQIIKNKIPIDLVLVKRKCDDAGDEFNIIKMFNNAKKLHKQWDKDMLPLLVEEISFQEVMQTLANHFNLKDEKDKIKKF